MSTVRGELTAPWNKRALATLLSSYKLKNIFNGMSLVCFINIYQPKRIIYLEKSVLVARIAKLD